jgi:hypothetical protein
MGAEEKAEAGEGEEKERKEYGQRNDSSSLHRSIVSPFGG